MMSTASRSRSLPTTLVVALVLGLFAAVPGLSRAEDGGVDGPPRMLPRPTVVSIPSILAQTPARAAAKPTGRILKSLGVLQAGPDLGEADVPSASLGGAHAPASKVATAGSSSHGFPGIDIVTQETAGTGAYAGTGGGLEPPDQALCVGNGFVMEGVNQAWQIFSTRGKVLTKPVLLAQFFHTLPNALVGQTSFLSDPKCLYDAPTKRFFATVLEIDEASTGAFTRAHNYIAVSKSSDPTKSWYVYNFDVTDDGQMGTPFHATCPCLGDQPLIGADANGFYMSTNEYSDAEVFPVEPPPATLTVLNKVFTIPDFRNGQAQVYALSKRALIAGASGPIVQFDSSSVPLPAGAPSGAVWSSLQPAAQPPGDGTSTPSNGAEFFLSQLDFATTGDNRIAVWALTNTASLNTSHPSLALQHTIVTTLNPKDTYTYAQSADQKTGPTPLGDGCQPVGCNEEKLNANDDRMNQVMLTNGHLWSAVNTLLPAIQDGGSGQMGDPRTGIMYFEIAPSLKNGKLGARMERDGYVQVPRGNVLFPSIGASPRGPVVMSFTLSGIDYYPSSAWTRLDGLAAGQAPQVNVAAYGAGPEDGFTGYCVQGILSNIGGQCSDGKSRWGDYSASAVDEEGCIWSGTEYISGIHRDPSAGNWATFITRVTPSPCGAAPLTPAPLFNLNPCLPNFTDPAGDDNYLGLETANSFEGKNPQMDIIKGSAALSPDGKSIITTLTLKNLSKTIATPNGQSNEYYFLWSYKGIQWFSHASVAQSGAVTYTDGQVNGNTYSDRTGSNDTGSFHAGPNGTVVVNVPLSAVGGAKRGQILQQLGGSTKELAGILLEPVDDTTPQHDYMLGQTC